MSLAVYTVLSCICDTNGFQSIAIRSKLAFVSTTSGSTIDSFSFVLFMAPSPQQQRNPPKEIRPPMNEEIRFSELRVVAPMPGGKDQSLGILSRAAALAKAKEMGGLDLILINDKSDPPVCKIVDYSKYKYSQEKKAKEIRKNSKVSEIKEVKMSYKIDVHDYDVRVKNTLKFLRQGNRVKCTVMFRGREVQHDNLGFELLDKMMDDLSETALRESKPKREGRNLAMILTPRPEVMKALSDERRAEERARKKKKKELLEQRASTKNSVGESGDSALTDLVLGDIDDFDDDDDDDEYEDEEDDDEEVEDMDDSLDALLGGKDDVTSELFK